MLWLVTWFTRLITDCTTLRAVARCPNISKHHPNTNLSAMEQNARLAAINLARSVFSLSQFASLTYATALSVVLDVLSTFFAERRLVREFGWCQACKLATDLRLRRLQEIRPRTLCRVQDVAPRLMAAVTSQPPRSLRREEGVNRNCPFSVHRAS